MIEEERQLLTGSFRLGIIPTVAPYLVPELLKEKELKYKEILLTLKEDTTDNIVSGILSGELDGGLMATPVNHPDLIEYPVYYEQFYAYVSPLDEAYRGKQIDLHSIDIHKIWLLDSVHCLRGQIEQLCKMKKSLPKDGLQPVKYESGSIDTLINIVDTNFGITIVPELFAMHLSEDKQGNLREFKDLIAVREVSIVVSKEYIRRKLLNKVLEMVADSVPKSMKNPELKQFAVAIL